MFTNLFSTSGSLTVMAALLCTAVSLFLGILTALIYRLDGKGNASFMTSLILLPILVQMIMMMVNGNLGTSVAVLGTFGLVRFRSVPGTSREICFIFMAMAIGLATGTGYLTFALFMGIVVLAVTVLLKLGRFFEKEEAARELRVTIPENLDYTEVFDEVFAHYLSRWTLEQVRTTHLGSMIECRYSIILKEQKQEKELIDALRCRNGNLTIICSRRGMEESL